MAMKERRGRGRTRVVRHTLTRLRMQAGPGEIVAVLARQGLVVSEELVRQVRIDMLKENAVVSNRRETRRRSEAGIRRDGRPRSHAAAGPEDSPSLLEEPRVCRRRH